MDTILYIYKKRGLSEPLIEPVGMKSYLLIRIALDVDAEEWFGIRLGQPRPEAAQPTQTIQTDETAVDPSHRHSVSGLFDWLSRRRERLSAERKEQKKGQVSAGKEEQKRGQVSAGREEQKRRRVLADRGERKRARLSARREEQERAKLLAEREERISRVAASVERLAAQLREMAEEPRDCFCVYEDSVRKNLTGKSPVSAFEEDFPGGAAGLQRTDGQELAALWETYFPWGEFRGYFGPFWVERLFQEAVHPHFVILGTAPCLFLLLEKHARRMKSVRWLIPEGDFGPEIAEFVEDFYTEYGLAVGLEILGNQAPFRRARLYCGAPANILDFTRETHPALSEVAVGSVWLDMLSVEEKKRRIAMRGAGITYVSLKEIWRRAQKRCGRPIFP